MYVNRGNTITFLFLIICSYSLHTQGICTSNRDVLCTATIQQSRCTVLNNTGIVQETLRNCSTSSQLHVTIKSGIQVKINLNPLVTHLLQLVVVAEEESTVSLHISSVPENLTLLSLSGNGRIKLSQRKGQNFFKYFKNVEAIILFSHFEFPFLPSFTSLRSLKTLVVVGIKGDTSGTGFGQVTCLDGNLVKGLGSLGILGWVDGNLEKITSDAFQGVSNLTTLNLRDNRIQSIEARALDSLVKATVIDLTGNIIRDVTPPLFHASTSLITLQLSNNPFFPLEALTGTYATNIYLDNNGYETLRAVDFQELMSRPVTISLTELLVCNCSLQWTAGVAGFGLEFAKAMCKWPMSSLGREIQTASYDGCNRSFECFGLNSACSEGELCIIDETGSYCGCPAGYRYNSQALRCEDINECENNVTCEVNCSNTIGSFYCSCGGGYQVAENRGDCEDINECLVENAGCKYACVNTNGGYVCVCESGETTSEMGECIEVGVLSSPLLIGGLSASIVLIILIMLACGAASAYSYRYCRRKASKSPKGAQARQIRTNSVNYENVDPNLQPYAVAVAQNDINGCTEERQYYVI